jgi:transposase InsO family protein
VQGLSVLSEADHKACQSWGIDIMGALPRASEGFRFLFVTINTFTKWLEAMPVINITQEATVKFLQSIIYKFSIPKWVLIDNGTQFKGTKFARWCADFSINHQASLAAQPQMNDQVERANGLILQGMMTMMFYDLEAKGRNWHKELQSVLRAFHTISPGIRGRYNVATRDISRISSGGAIQ